LHGYRQRRDTLAVLPFIKSAELAILLGYDVLREVPSLSARQKLRFHDGNQTRRSGP
jgi:hypothetical protein